MGPYMDSIPDSFIDTYVDIAYDSLIGTVMNKDSTADLLDGLEIDLESLTNSINTMSNEEVSDLYEKLLGSLL